MKYYINNINLRIISYCLIIIVYSLLFDFTSFAQNTFLSETKTKSGLVFEKDFEYRLEDSLYTDVIQLLSLEDRVQAIQFRILINKAVDDSTILIFQDIQKGPDLSDPNWLFEYNVSNGPIAPNGASQDEIYVVLYNSSNMKGGLLPGDHNNLIYVNYIVADLPDLKNSIKSSMKISHAGASTFEGIKIDITPTHDEFKIYTKVM